MACLAQSGNRGLTVYCVYHYLFGRNLLKSLYPRLYVTVCSIVHVMAARCARKEHCLYYYVTLELTEGLDNGIQVIMAHRIVYHTDIINIHCVKFLDIVVQLEQGIEYGRIRNTGTVAQYAHLGIRKEFVTQCQYIVHNTGELGVGGGLAVTCKGQHVGFGPIGLHLGKGGAQGLIYLRPGGPMMMRMVLAVTAALAVDAVKGAYLTVGGHQVYTQ